MYIAAFIKKIYVNIIRRIRAARLGIDFKRVSCFKFPSTLRYHGGEIAIYTLEEEQPSLDFIAIFLDDCYGLKHLRKQDIKNIIDIGANIGMFCINAKRLFPNSVLHAYEANPKLSKYLKKHSGQMGFKYFMEAVGSESGQANLRLDNVTTRSAIFLDPSDKTIVVPQVSFKDIIQRIGGYADLVKSDCEGGGSGSFLKIKKVCVR